MKYKKLKVKNKEVKAISVNKLIKEKKIKNRGDVHSFLEDSIGGTTLYNMCGYGFSSSPTGEGMAIMNAGTVLEEHILKQYQGIERDYTIYKGGNYIYQLEQEGKKYHALLDGLAIYNNKYNRQKKIIDVKTHFFPYRFGSPRYIIQMQHYMHITGIDTAIIVHWYGGKIEKEVIRYDFLLYKKIKDYAFKKERTQEEKEEFENLFFENKIKNMKQLEFEPEIDDEGHQDYTPEEEEFKNELDYLLEQKEELKEKQKEIREEEKYIKQQLEGRYYFDDNVYYFYENNQLIKKEAK